jgi:uncharacterized repeat protein (TIGR03803 family)
MLYRFKDTPDGASVVAGLIEVSGALFGTTTSGSTSGVGTIYAVLAHSGQEIVVYSFGGGSNGYNPSGDLTNVGGTLYGTTTNGGTSGSGTVFVLSP